MNKKSLLIVISGPTCVGKRNINNGLQLYCKLGLIKSAFSKITLYNCREIRPGETDGKDYHFCTGKELDLGTDQNKVLKRIVAGYNTTEYIKSKNLIVTNENKTFIYSVNGTDIQGLTISEIKTGVNFLEIKDDFYEELRRNAAFQDWISSRNLKVLRFFVAPITFNTLKLNCLQNDSTEEDEIYKDLKTRLTLRKKLNLSIETSEDMEKRLNSGVKEVLEAFKYPKKYDAIVVNPFSENSIPWGTENTIPTKEARGIVDTFARIINAQLL